MSDNLKDVKDFLIWYDGKIQITDEELLDGIADNMRKTLAFNGYLLHIEFKKLLDEIKKVFPFNLIFKAQPGSEESK